MSDYYDRNGTPMTMDAWAKIFGDRGGYGRVGYVEVGDAGISTVWLGLDHRHSGDGGPLVFETMVFGGRLDQECQRYTTEAEAMAGHLAMIERVREAGS